MRSEFVREQMESELRTLRTLKAIEPNHPNVQNTNRRVISVLTEPRTEQVFGKTNLPINGESLKRVLKATCSMSDVKATYGDSGSLQISCAMDTSFHTAYYAAYEDAGCMSFFSMVFVLGRVDNRYVVGVVNNDVFFIMATRRLYSRFSQLAPNLLPVEFDMEMLETLNLPFAVQFEHSLAMLEARQILRNQQKYGKEYNYLVKALGITGIQPLHPGMSLICNEDDNIEDEKRSWLQKLISFNFAETFTQSLLKFPLGSTNAANAYLFVENVTRLWIHKILRIIHGKENAQGGKSPIPSPMQITPKQLFSMDVDAFVSHYLPCFGLPNHFPFKCYRLGPDGLPMAVCADSLTAQSVGQHIEKCHTHPFVIPNDDLDTMHLEFIPFTLVFQQQRTPATTSKACNTEVLNSARLIVESYRGNGYLEALELIDLKSPNSRGGKKRSAPGGSVKGQVGQAPSQKKKRVSEDSLP